MFNPCKEDSASGFRIEPPRPTPGTESSEDPQHAHPTRIFHSGPLVNQSQPSKAGGGKNDELQVPGVANHPVVVSSRTGPRADDSSWTMVAQAGAFSHGRRLSESINEHLSNSGKYDQVFPKKDDRNIRADGAIVSNVLPETQKGEKLDCPVSAMVTALLVQNCILTCIAKLKKIIG